MCRRVGSLNALDIFASSFSVISYLSIVPWAVTHNLNL
jgi:hypothetical protein